MVCVSSLRENLTNKIAGKSQENGTNGKRWHATGKRNAGEKAISDASCVHQQDIIAL